MEALLHEIAHCVEVEQEGAQAWKRITTAA
jgi:hypothetical protein